MRGEYRVRHPDLKPLHAEAVRLRGALGGDVRITHVPRARNKDADRMVNAMLDRAAQGAGDTLHEVAAAEG
jgi:hypothetical protein